MTTTCLIPGCNGSWHDEDICDTVLADTATPAGASLIAEVEASPTEPTTLVVWEGEDGRDLLRTTNRADAVAFATNLRELADAVERGAALLAPNVLASVAQTAMQTPAAHDVAVAA
ncbi:hypothetical protein ACIO6U_03835 [Streptomyces sp. NPDC087422]|uniref:hypothetical protein n=1 Tax=Streptomyces sp. NPDC087422 TaxID=3365786 RepID=UPI0037FC621C